jgi:predicted nucleic acid-binding Zn ribbon protein
MIESIGVILKSLNRGAPWQQQQEFDLLVRSWLEVVGPVVSQHAHPLELRDGRLLVATSNAVWAQQLRFESPRILAKLKGQLAQPLQEIRFSPARWHQPSISTGDLSNSAILKHPSRRSRSDSPGVSRSDSPGVSPSDSPGVSPSDSPGVSPHTENDPTINPPLKLQLDRTVAQTSQAAFQKWADQIRWRSQGLPLCPQCRCPTPMGELQHWSVCALCAVKSHPRDR